jgi:hypothetical protein
MDNTPEILAECQLDHPFFIKEKGESAKKNILMIGHQPSLHQRQG